MIQRYDRLVSDRSETVLTTINAINAYSQCAGGDTGCVADSLAQMKMLKADLKARGVKLEDTERIGLNSYIGSAEAALGNGYGALSAAAMGAAGTKGSEAGNAHTSSSALEAGLNNSVSRSRNDILERDRLIADLPAEIKISPENVVDIRKLSDGRTVWLESGNSTAGLKHIVQQHGSEFLSMGVSEYQIPGLIMKTISEGKIVGYQGQGAGRPIYEIELDGKMQRIAITIGNNGFIVGANPRGAGK